MKAPNQAKHGFLSAEDTYEPHKYHRTAASVDHSIDDVTVEPIDDTFELYSHGSL